MVQSTARQPANSSNDDSLVEIVIVAALRLTWFVTRRVLLLGWWAILFPMLSLPALTAVYVLIVHGWASALAVVAVTIVVLVLWRLVWPGSFRHLVSFRIWTRRRRHRVYRHPWAAVCALHGLTTPLDGQPVIPRLRKIRIGYAADELLVQLIPGQTVADWAGQSDAFAHSFGANTVNVTAAGPGRVLITVHHADSLAEPIRVSAPSELVDLEAVPVGVTESGTPWLVRVIGRHLLIAGATGSGKGSVVWSLLTGLAPLIRDGVVQAWVVDPKGGMEFGRGTALFARFAYDTTEQTLTLLHDAATILAERAERLRGVTRQHVPTISEPLILLVIDELASLTAYQTDRKVAAEITQILGLILSQGRAVGVNVIGCVQDPAKDIVAMRQLFPTRIGLRLAEATQVGMVLGAGAREAGALCDQISDSLPGIGYICEDGTTTVTRVRAFHVTDADIDTLAAGYRPAPTDEDSGATPAEPDDTATPGF
ncbi:FtsK/SpoIIIE domain-containing protein [Microbacterium sp.]|uniref:FtsK/SpoIIIE domain-containing protein n=1 Tax=Microbacterium sp. TaxID=51671 RepID=UPI003F96CEBF